MPCEYLRFGKHRIGALSVLRGRIGIGRLPDCLAIDGLGHLHPFAVGNDVFANFLRRIGSALAFRVRFGRKQIRQVVGLCLLIGADSVNGDIPKASNAPDIGFGSVVADADDFGIA